MSNVRIGFIGTGGIAGLHAKQLQELPEDAAIVAIADPNEESRRRFLTNNPALAQVAQFADHIEMLDGAELDAVVICSPHTLHFAQAADVLRAGLHVLIEKPMTCSSAEAEELLRIAELSGKIMQVSYQRHFQPEFLFIKEAIDGGLIGKLTSVTASLYQGWAQGGKNSWRKNPALSGGGMLMDSGSHIVDVLLWTTGLTPSEVFTVIHQQQTPVEIDSFTSIRFAEGAVAGLNIIGHAPCWHETYAFCGETGGIFYDNGQITIRRLREEHVVPELPQQTTNQDKSFIDAVLGRREVAVSGEFALKVVKLTETIYQAGRYSPIPVTN
ncbi:Predicted dehydrogenase [Paenibacillus sp. UNC496MF]|uniref:Gfo/Idh/MocA family protein n=1 Tax=Paenibacillus sp. UNC496MF TaxID=1502753 RepID=UPI0008E21724|nr:Gfo/Idh/MocA family oxidoreductase [Paenibacillus sp. UNC496MF]SFI38329.1 Predicted dehydrogenase [Paenibacillus sp. UNC496MF]